MRFYLGTHETSWLGRTDVPLFVSRRRLARRRSLPRALGPWALDSGAFSEIREHGRWTVSEAEYVEDVARYRDEIGGLEWAAPMDWMVEPEMLDRTGLSVREHQERTTANYLRLAETGLPFVPVLQGWTLDDYLAHADLYEGAGVRLRGRLVGVGSVCRRQHTAEIGAIVDALAGGRGLELHGFGVKVAGIAAYGRRLASADSLAWSYQARRNPPLRGCTHRSCSSCLDFALRWRRSVVAGISPHEQLTIGGPA